jgi:hypothetical protein
VNKSTKILLLVSLSISLLAAIVFFFFFRHSEDFPVPGISRNASDKFLKKISSLAEPSPIIPAVLEINEPEINSFLYYHLDQSPVQGIKHLHIELENQQATIHARVNFDELTLEKNGGKNTLWRLVLHGEHNLDLTTALVMNEGSGRYQVQRARFDQGEIPKTLLNLLVSNLASKKIPGVEPDGSFRLPKGIDRIEIKPGKAVVYRKTN